MMEIPSTFDLQLFFDTVYGFVLLVLPVLMVIFFGGAVVAAVRKWYS